MDRTCKSVGSGISDVETHTSEEGSSMYSEEILGDIAAIGAALQAI